MTNIGIRKNQAVFNFDRLPDVTVVTDRRIPTDIAVRTDLAICTNHNISLDEDAWEDTGAGANVNDALNDSQRMNFALDQVFS